MPPRRENNQIVMRALAGTECRVADGGVGDSEVEQLAAKHLCQRHGGLVRHVQSTGVHESLQAAHQLQFWHRLPTGGIGAAALERDGHWDQVGNTLAEHDVVHGAANAGEVHVDARVSLGDLASCQNALDSDGLRWIRLSQRSLLK